VFSNWRHYVLTVPIPSPAGKSTLHTRGLCHRMDMYSSLSISWFMSRTHPYSLTYNKCRQCGLFHMSAPSPRVFHCYSLTITYRRILTSETTTLGTPLASIRVLSSLTVFYRFFDDVQLLRQRWQSANTDSVGQLYVAFRHLSDDRCSRAFFGLSRLIDFFKYFSRDFLYNTGVASIRAGLLKKDSKGWQNDVTTFSRR
jgi:hypothetical protein